MSKGSIKSAHSTQTPTSFASFAILPLTLPAIPSFPHSATHYLYVRPSKPLPTDQSPESAAQRARELFLSNVPTYSTESNLKELFKDITGGVGRVEAVVFEGQRKKERKGTGGTGALASVGEGGSRKRKRPGMEELEESLKDERAQLPGTWSRELRPSGSSAVVVFVDRASAEAAMKVIKRKAKRREAVVWKWEESGGQLGSKSTCSDVQDAPCYGEWR